jgi:diguanylate cyclase (GGDEF)-like protein
MRGARHPSRSTARLFALYAVVSLVPVLLLGFVLAASFRSVATERGLSVGRAEAALVARTAVEPLLQERPLTRSLPPAEIARLRTLASRAIGEHQLLRIRLRDLAGRVVFSGDGSGFVGKPEDEALAAAHGRVVALITRLNSDANDTGSIGVSAVEVYLPLSTGTPPRQVGVLELYLPYAPIARDVAHGLNGLYVDLAVGLGILYLVLFVITAWISRSLRRGAALNAFLAERDPLTGLPNRTLFLRRAATLLADVERRHRPVVLAIVDLDRFKAVNDTLGHQNGDQLLTELAGRLSAQIRPGDVVARLGGDEFGLILSDVSDTEAGLERLRAVIEREVEVSGVPLSVQASVGYVVAPDDGVDVDTLLRRADVAMYVAKRQHVGVVRYDPSLDQYDAASLTLVSELRQAIDDEQLVLHYQPQMVLADGRVSAVEALVRWRHPVHGLLYPGDFLELAEQTDLIDKLTRWVLSTALHDIGDLDDELRISVNVSARSISRDSFADEVIEALVRAGVPARRLIIEVTETALLADPGRAAGVLARLAAAGVRISLDDFGRGQTSLAYLSALPISELKVDRGFVADMRENPAHAAIVRSVVDLGHNLLLRVVGEGVETEEVLAELRECGCDLVQGFLVARPMPIEDLGRFAHRAGGVRSAIPA